MDDFQSVLRKLRDCFHFCFEFVDMLHFGNSVPEVFEFAITRVVIRLGMLDELKRRFGIMSRFFYSLLLVGKDIWR